MVVIIVIIIILVVLVVAIIADVWLELSACKPTKRLRVIAAAVVVWPLRQRVPPLTQHKFRLILAPRPFFGTIACTNFMPAAESRH